MTDQKTKTRTKTKVKTEQPRLYKVILINDDYTPREFVVIVLRGIFHLSEEEASRVMLTAHMKGSCVVTVLARDLAETKAEEGNEAGRRQGFPLQFVTEPEE